MGVSFSVSLIVFAITNILVDVAKIITKPLVLQIKSQLFLKKVGQYKNMLLSERSPEAKHRLQRNIPAYDKCGVVTRRHRSKEQLSRYISIPVLIISE